MQSPTKLSVTLSLCEICNYWDADALKKLTSATLALAWAELGNNADQEEIMQVLEVMMQVLKVKMNVLRCDNASDGFKKMKAAQC